MNRFHIGLIVAAALAVAPNFQTPSPAAPTVDIGSQYQLMSERVAHWSADDIRTAAQDRSPLTGTEIIRMISSILPFQSHQMGQDTGDSQTES